MYFEINYAVEHTSRTSIYSLTDIVDAGSEKEAILEIANSLEKNRKIYMISRIRETSEEEYFKFLARKKETEKILDKHKRWNAILEEIYK